MMRVANRPSVVLLFFAGALFIVAIFGFRTPTQAQQVDAGANAQCQGSWTGYFSACMARPGATSAQCTQEANGKNLGTGCSGKCSGLCNFPMGGGGIANVCGGLQCGNQPEKGSDAGAQKAMDMAKQLMDALKGKAGGGGGGGGGAPPPPGGEKGQGQQTTPAPASFNDLLNATSAPASFAETVADRVSSAAANLISTVFGGSSEVKNAEEVQTEEEVAAESEGGLFGQQPVTGSTAASDRAKGSGIITTGGEEGFAGSVRSFFNQFFNPAAENQSFFNKLCSARPWQATFITRVFSASFFDSLCAQQEGGSQNGVFNPVGGTVRYAQMSCPSRVKTGTSATIQWDCGQSQSAGFGFDTSGQASGVVSITPEDTGMYYLRCGNGGRAQCSIYVEKPRAQITAYPAHAKLNSRSEIFWTSENVVECVIEGPGLKELGIRGAATTPVILNAVTYVMVCHDDAGREARSAVTVDVGN